MANLEFDDSLDPVITETRDVRDAIEEAYVTRTGQLWPNAGSGQTAARQ